MPERKGKYSDDGRNLQGIFLKNLKVFYFNFIIAKIQKWGWKKIYLK